MGSSGILGLCLLPGPPTAVVFHIVGVRVNLHLYLHTYSRSIDIYIYIIIIINIYKYVGGQVLYRFLCNVGAAQVESPRPASGQALRPLPSAPGPLIGMASR